MIIKLIEWQIINFNGPEHRSILSRSLAHWKKKSVAIGKCYVTFVG